MGKRIRACVAIFCVILMVYAPGYVRADDENVPYPYLNLAAFEELIGREVSGALFPSSHGRQIVYIPNDFMYIDGERGMFVVFAASADYGVRLIQKHNVRDLVRSADVTAEFSADTPYVWENYRERHFVPLRNTIYIQTVDGIRYEFVLSLGSIADSRDVVRQDGGPRPQFIVEPGQGTVIGFGIIVACGLVVVFLYLLESW